MAYTDNYDQIQNYLYNWYYYYSNSYLVEYTALDPNNENNKNIPLFKDIIKNKENNIANRELIIFNAITNKNSYLDIISTIVFENMAETSIKQFKNKTTGIEPYKYDLRNLIDISKYSIEIMDYLCNKYDFVYIEYWRNKETIMKYMNNSLILEQNCLTLFKTYRNIDDLIRIYNNIKKISYNGLIITTYVKFINEDILKQSQYCNPIHIFNINEELFE